MIPRPTKKSDEVVTLAAEYLLEIYDDSQDSIEEDEHDSYIKAVKDAIFHTACYFYDAYEIGKQLEDDGFSVDYGFVSDFCSEFEPQLNKALDTLVKQWVVKSDIKPTFAIDDIVKVKYRDDKIYSGTICKIDSNEAKYGVFIEKHHKIDGRTGKPSSYSIYEWEQVDEWNGKVTFTNQPDLFESANVIVPHNQVN